MWDLGGCKAPHPHSMDSHLPLCLSVSDQGLGVAPGYRPDILFETGQYCPICLVNLPLALLAMGPELGPGTPGDPWSGKSMDLGAEPRWRGCYTGTDAWNQAGPGPGPQGRLSGCRMHGDSTLCFPQHSCFTGEARPAQISRAGAAVNRAQGWQGGRHGVCTSGDGWGCVTHSQPPGGSKNPGFRDPPAAPRE